MGRKALTAVAATAIFLFGCALAYLVPRAWAVTDPDIGTLIGTIIGGITGILTGLFIIVRSNG